MTAVSAPAVVGKLLSPWLASSATENRNDRKDREKQRSFSIDGPPLLIEGAKVSCALSGLENWRFRIQGLRAAKPLEQSATSIAGSPGGAKVSCALSGLENWRLRIQGFRCAPPLATFGRPSGAAGHGVNSIAPQFRVSADSE